MKLTKVNTGDQYPLMQYQFLFDGNTPVGAGNIECPQRYSAIEWERKLDDAYDALYDRYGDLYEDEHGNLYGVEMMFNGENFIPGVWQRVQKIK